MRVKLTNLSATGKFAVLVRLPFSMLSHSVCPGVHAQSLSVAGSAMRCWVALVRGEEGEVLMGGGEVPAGGG